MTHFFGNIVLVCCLTASLSFTPSYTIDDVTGAMQSGNAAMLSRYFDNMVDITLQDKTHAYSRSQAEAIIKDFFKCHGVKAFQVSYKGVCNGAEYCVGELQTKNGTFRTTIFMRSRSQKQVLQELRFNGVK